MNRSWITVRVLIAAAAAATGCASCTGDVAGGSAAPEVPSFATSAPGSAPPSSPSTPTASSSESVPAAVPPAAPEPADPAPVASSPECRSGELRLELGRGDAGAGTVYRPLVFTNVGRRACVIQGFPGVSYVAGDDGHQVGPAAFREGGKGAAITLVPGATANAPIGFTQVRNFDPAACRPTAVRGLRVYPPHETASVFVAMDGLGCAGDPPGNQLRVRTMQPGAGA